jgi:hypothetical protein
MCQSLCTTRLLRLPSRDIVNGASIPAQANLKVTNMADYGTKTDSHESSERRTSPATIILILLGIAIIGAVGYDAYLRGRATQEQEQQVVAASQATQQAQQQLQDALARVAQSDANAQASEQEKTMWMSIARAAAGTVAARPFSLFGLQRGVFSSADPQTRQFLRDYFKKAENLEKVSGIVVFVAGLIEPPAAMRRFVQACQPMFTGPLPDTSPTNPDTLWCYEFLKRRQAEGGDMAAWQKLLADATAQLGKRS